MGRRRRRRGSRGRKPAPQVARARASEQTDAAGFWGDPSALPTETDAIHITDDPSAVARSLGPPPLPGHREVAEHYFNAIYDRAVATAGALAAAGGLIRPDELGVVRDDED